MIDWASFEEQFPWLAKSLRHAAKAGRLSHSYLVVSSDVEIREQFPRLLAALTACQRRSEDGSPCGTCPACHQLLHGLYPDLFLLAPASKSRQIKVGDDDTEPGSMRNFITQFHLGGISASGWKIGIVQDADAMNDNAQNAFLKTLEEPPDKCLFILSTGNPATLLPTIRSRCQILTLTKNVCRYDMERFASLSPILLEHTTHPKTDLCAAENVALSLIEILNQLRSVSEEKIKEKWAPKLKEAEFLEQAGLKLLDAQIKGETASEYLRLREQFLSYVHTWFAQLYLLASGADQSLLPNPEIMTPWFQSNPPHKLKEREAFRLLNDAEDLVAVLKKNVNDELAIRAFALKPATR